MSTESPGHTHRTPSAHGHATGAHDYALPELPDAVDIFDTTLRDGSQQEGLSLTVDDKLRVAEQLDHLGVTYIEGGWPGANPKDDEFFRRAPTELALSTSTLVAFGSTRRAGVAAEDDDVLRKLVDAQTPAVCIVAKSWDRHVTDALRTSLDEAVAMVADSVAFLRRHDKRVFLDAEHFFDGYRHNPEFALQVLRAAEEAGAEALVLCDTNGGTLPFDVERVGGRCASAGPGPRSASTATTTRAARWPTRWPRCGPGPPRSRAASTATASGPATPTCRRPSPTSRSSCGSGPSRPTGWSA